MPSKLGAHVVRMNGPTAAFINAGPAVVKFIGEWGAAAGLPPETLVIGAVKADGDAQGQYATGKTPAQAAAEFLHDWGQLAVYQKNPAIRYWEGHNEPVWIDEAGVAWYAQMEIERMKQMEAVGLKCVIGNFSTGVPCLEWWPAFLPACQYAMEHGHYLGLHEYSTPFMWWGTGTYQKDKKGCYTSDNRLAGWTTLRYRLVYDRYLKPAGLDRLPLIITEAGLDPLAVSADNLPHGWPAETFKYLGEWWSRKPSAWGYPLPNDFVPAGGWLRTHRDRFYFEQLWWYDQHLRQDDYVVGAAIFTFGNFGPPWKDFDVSDGAIVADLLTEYIQQEKRPG